MKILFSGYHNPHFPTITEYIEKAIRDLGHELISFDDRQHILPGRIRYRVPWLRRLDLEWMNRKLLSRTEVRPDVAIISGGHRISSTAIREIKKRRITTVLWTIDPPMDFQPIVKTAPLYDHIFCQGTEAVEILDHAGIKGARWLPMACDPSLHHPVPTQDLDRKTYASDVAFLGSFYPVRAALFESLASFDLAIWGPGWENLRAESPLKNRIRGFHMHPSEWLKIYSSSRIVLATHFQDPEGRFPVYQASPRIFEAMACGSFVLSDNQRDVFTLFRNGEHLAGFKNSEDLAEKVRYFLGHPEERMAIAKRGMQEVLQHHTYRHRVTKLLSAIGWQG